MILIYLPYFPDYKPRLFFKKFLYSGATYVRTFPKTTHYTLHATAFLDQHLITISSPTVLHNHLLSLQPCGHPSHARRVSLSVYAWCLIQWQSTALQYMAAVYCTHRQSVGKLPPDVPCWAHSSGPQVALVISRSARLNASCRILTHTRHTIDPLHGAHSRCLGLSSNYCITADFRPPIKPACRVFWTTSISSCRSFSDLLMMCMHPRTFLRARK